MLFPDFHIERIKFINMIRVLPYLITSDTGKLWKNILGWLNWASSSFSTKLLSQGNLETSPSRMADIQNKYYVEKVQPIRRSLQGHDQDPWKF